MWESLAQYDENEIRLLVKSPYLFNNQFLQMFFFFSMRLQWNIKKHHWWSLPSGPLLAFSDSSAKSITATHKCVCVSGTGWHHMVRLCHVCSLNSACVNVDLQLFFHSAAFIRWKASVNPLLLVSGVTCLAQCCGYCHVLSVTYLSTPAWVFSNDQCTHSAKAYKLKP